MCVGSLSGEDSREEGRATHSNTLAWRIPWTGEPGGLQSTGLQRVRHDCGDLARAPLTLERPHHLSRSPKGSVNSVPLLLRHRPQLALLGHRLSPSARLLRSHSKLQHASPRTACPPLVRTVVIPPYF